LSFIYKYLWWNVSGNYNFVNDAFTISLPFPWNIFYARRIKNKNKLEGIEFLDSKKFINLVESCFDTLSKKLGKNDFFFGGSPTLLDSVVFSYLMVIITPNFSNPENLNDTFKKYKNLLNYCNRIMQTYYTEYPFCPIKIKNQKEKEEEENKIAEKEERKLYRKTTKSIGVALFIFALYASLINEQTIELITKNTSE